MTIDEEFWEPSTPPDIDGPLHNWVRQNVADAMEHFIDNAGLLVRNKQGRLEVTFISDFEKPHKEGEMIDAYMKTIDLTKNAVDEAASLRQFQFSQEQIRELEEFCEAFDRLAFEVRKAAGMTLQNTPEKSS